MSVDETEIDISPIIVYPNPASDVMQVVLPDSGSYEYTITDMSGSILLSGQTDYVSQINLDISILESGMYHIRLSKGENSYAAKFVKV